MRQRGGGGGGGGGGATFFLINLSRKKKKKKSLIWFKDQILFTASILYNEKNIGVEPAINCGLSLSFISSISSRASSLTNFHRRGTDRTRLGCNLQAWMS